MARVFISHSGRDNACARDIRAWLGELGYDAPFLDIDKDSGIAPGADWERTLYREMERADAVIIILTANWMASKWCFAEFTQARALGKPIFPIIETPAGEQLVANDIQQLDLRTDREGGLARLARELERIASDIHRGYKFKPGRPPFPGLFAFEEDDAAIYFGRDDEIRRLTGLLRAQRASGSGNVWAILGASGSGKSSLMRAGILPAMAQEAPAWTVLKPCRLKDRPIAALALTFALALDDGAAAAWEDSLLKDPSAALNDFERRLKTKPGAAETQIVVSIDQFEELLIANVEPERKEHEAGGGDRATARDGGSVPAILDGRNGAADAVSGRTETAEQAAMWHLLKIMSERRASFLVIMTIRSDFLDALQAAKRRGFDFVPFPLDPLPQDRIPDIIRKPARVVGLRIDEEVVQAAIRDAGSGYALPLLAFALREIYEAVKSKKDDGHWTLEDYDALGADKLNPIENAVRQAAERVMGQAETRGDDRGLVRRLFVPRLVRVNDEGRYVKQPGRYAELDRAERQLAADLVAARLLSIWEEKGADLIEVAHEALFLKWPTLHAILEEDREFLIGREQLKRDLKDWLDAPADLKPLSLLHGAKLHRAAGWLAARREQLSSDERGFIGASVAAAATLERRQRARRIATIAASLLVAAGSVVAAYWIDVERRAAETERQAAEVARKRANEQRDRAEAERARAEAALLVNESGTALAAGRGATAAGLAARAMGRDDNRDTRSALLKALLATSGQLAKTQPTHGMSSQHLVWSRDGKQVILADLQGKFASWRVADETRFAPFAFAAPYDPKTSRAGPAALAIDRAGELSVIGSDGLLTRGKAEGPLARRRLLKDPDSRVRVAATDGSGHVLAVADYDANAPLLFDRSGAPLRVPVERCEAARPAGGGVSALALDAQGVMLAIGYSDGWLCAMSLRDGAAKAIALAGNEISALSIAPGTRRIAVRARDQASITVLAPDLPPDRAGWTTLPAAGSSPVLAWSPDGALIAGGCDAQAICVWRGGAAGATTEFAKVAQWIAEAAPVAVAWSPDGRSLASADVGGTLALWTMEIDRTVFTHAVAADALTSLAVSSDGALAVIGTEAGQHAVWEIAADRWHLLPGHQAGPVVSIAWHPSQPWFAAATQDGDVTVTSWPDREQRHGHRFADGRKLKALQWLRGGEAIAVAALDGRIALWAPDKTDAIREIAAQGADETQALVVDPPRERLLTTGADGRVRAWSLANPERATVFEEARGTDAHADARDGLTISPDGTRLVVTGNDGRLLVYTLATGRIEVGSMQAAGRSMVPCSAPTAPFSSRCARIRQASISGTRPNCRHHGPALPWRRSN